MELEKAIEILKLRVKDYIPGYDPYERNAAKLGIEALEVVLEFRTGLYKTINSPLPGETKD